MIAIIVSERYIGMEAELTKEERECADRLIQIRKNLEMTQFEMAFYGGVSLESYGRYERKECAVSGTFLLKLAATGLVDIEYLMTGSKERSNLTFAQMLSSSNEMERVGKLREVYMYYKQRVEDKIEMEEAKKKEQEDKSGS